MKASEIIKEIQKLIDREGDKEFHVYKVYSKETVDVSEVHYDHTEDDIYTGVYA